MDIPTLLPWIWLAVFCAIGTLGLRMGMRRFRPLAQHPIVLHLLVLTTGLHLFTAPVLTRLHPDALRWLQVVLLILAFMIALRFLDLWLFDILRARRKKPPVPLVLRDILRWMLTVVALFLIVRAFFPAINLNVLAFSSIVVGYILGNASQDTLGNLISGLALNTEGPFSIGDWVEIDGHTGEIVDMTWRSTCLRTKLDDYVTLPNATISRSAIINYSRPSQVHGIKMPVGVHYSVPPNTVRRVLKEAMASVPEVLATPPTQVNLRKFGDFAIEYEMKYFIRSFTNMEPIKSHVMDRVWYHFQREGIVIPFPIRDVNLHHVTPEALREKDLAYQQECLSLLSRIDLFRPLPEEARQGLARKLRPRVYGIGEQLVGEGEPGTTFFLIASGLVSVHHDGTELAQLGPGGFFGEMSLLTGEKRSATVRAEEDTSVLVLDHEVLRPLLDAHPDLAESMAAALAQRRQQQEAADHRTPLSEDAALASSKTTILSAIRRFFRMAG
jgi:small-conductance mechanosensitive channel/CRP-like cAMP-binding protein